MATERLQVILQMQAQQYKREARESAAATGRISQEAKTAGGQTGLLEQKSRSLGSSLRGYAVTGAILAVGRGLFSAAEAAERSKSAFDNTEQIIKKTGGAANVTADDVVKLSRRLSALTGVQDEVVQEGANVLLTFKNLKNEAGEGNDVFDRTASLMLDVGAVMGTDATSGAIQLGKALNDPVANMGALSRAGLTFSDTQKQQIKDLVSNNDLLSAQKLILGELESQLGGTAAASADSSDKIANAFGEIGESVGAALLPVLDLVAIELQHITGLTSDLDRVAAHAGTAADNVSGLFTLVAEETGGAGFISGFGATVDELVTGLIPGIDRVERFRETLEAAVSELDVSELVKARDNIGLLEEQFGVTAEEADILREILDDRLGKAASESADEVLKLKGATDRSGASASTAGGETEYYVRQLRNLRLAQLELLNPALGAINALGRYKQALVDSREAIAEYGAESEEAKEAGLNLLESYSNLIGEAQNYAEVAGVSLRDAITNLGTDAGLTDDQIQYLIDSLQELDGLVIRPNVVVEVKTKTVTVGGVTVNPGETVVKTGSNIFRHSGGPGVAGHEYLIKPDEEIFVPSGNGQFLLNDQVINALKGLSRPNGATHNYSIPITSTGDHNADAQLVGAVASVLRRMESI